MEAFVRIEGIAAPLHRPNIDTDAIVPSREITSPGREGYGEKLFAPWRYLGPDRRENPDFVLNRVPFRAAPILIAGDNFGCGSSREMAVWALRQFGIRVVVAPSFGAIFRSNCLRNGILPVVLPAATVTGLAARAEAGDLVLAVDLEKCVVTTHFSRSTASTSSPASARAASTATVAAGSTTGRMPFLRQLARKIAPNEGAITARMPNCRIAHTAISREEPQPKFSPAIRMDAARNGARLSTKSGFSRRSGPR